MRYASNPRCTGLTKVEKALGLKKRVAMGIWFVRQQRRLLRTVRWNTQGVPMWELQSEDHGASCSPSTHYFYPLHPLPHTPLSSLVRKLILPSHSYTFISFNVPFFIFTIFFFQSQPLIRGLFCVAIIKCNSHRPHSAALFSVTQCKPLDPLQITQHFFVSHSRRVLFFFVEY